ncbi:MAG: hypothetical protein U0929_16565 [Planctomycetaceae bacterium]
MSTYQAFDSNGNEVFLTEINSLCPIAYATEARQIAHDYFVNVEKCPVQLEEMFTKFVKPIGESEATHVWCPRIGYTHQLNWQVETMTSYELSWIGNRVYTLADDHEEIKSKFVCLTDSKEEILEALGLEEM